jgi:prepilin-type N-terminal cleavage/methylation domain-containing protein
MKPVFKGTIRQGGFTLVELLIAMSILSFGILVVASMQISAIRGNAVSGLVSHASNFAVDKAEKLMRLGYHDAALNDSDGDGIGGLGDAAAGTADHNETVTSSAGKSYHVFWNIAADQPIAGTKTVKVIATWDERGEQKNTSLDFIKADM